MERMEEPERGPWMAVLGTGVGFSWNVERAQRRMTELGYLSCRYTSIGRAEEPVTLADDGRRKATLKLN